VPFRGVADAVPVAAERRLREQVVDALQERRRT
jgi:hypothetical protein